MSENNNIINGINGINGISGVDDFGSVLLAQTTENEQTPQPVAQDAKVTQDAETVNAISAEVINRAIDAGYTEYTASITAGVQGEQALEAAIAIIEQVALQQGVPEEQVARSWFAGLGADAANIEIGFTTLSIVVGIEPAFGGIASGITVNREIVNAAIEAGREHFENSVSAGEDPADVVGSTVEVIEQAVLDEGASPQQAALVAQIAKVWFSSATESGVSAEVALDALASAVVTLSNPTLFTEGSTTLEAAIEATDAAAEQDAVAEATETEQAPAAEQDTVAEATETEQSATEQAPIAEQDAVAEQAPVVEETPASADYDLPWDQGDFATADSALDSPAIDSAVSGSGISVVGDVQTNPFESTPVEFAPPPPPVSSVPDSTQEDDDDVGVPVIPVDPAVIALAKIVTYANDDMNPLPTVADYTTAGVEGVTDDNLNAVNFRVDEAPDQDDNDPTDSLLEIQDLAVTGITAATSAQSKINSYAGDSSATTTPSAADYRDAGVTGVTGVLGGTSGTRGNIAAVNARVDAVNGADADSVAELQGLADVGIALARIAAYADDITNPLPTATDYATIGVTAGNVGAVNAEVVRATLDDDPAGVANFNTVVGQIQTQVKIVTPVFLSIADAEHPEGADFTFIVTRSGDATGVVQVNYRVVLSNMDNPANVADFGSPLAGTLTFAAGQTRQTITVPIVDDADVEPSEVFTVALDAAVNTGNPTADITISDSDSDATGTILNDDGGMVIELISSPAAEGASGERIFIFRVRRDNELDKDLTITWEISLSDVGGTLANAADFKNGQPLRGVVALTPNVRYVDFDIVVLGDTVVESDETFTVGITAVNDNDINEVVDILISSATATIVTDEVQFSIRGAPMLKEGGPGEKTDFTFIVTRSGDLTGEASVGYTVDGDFSFPESGAESEDFIDPVQTMMNGFNTAAGIGTTFPSGRVVFADGISEQTITIEVSGDASPEENEGEKFKVTLRDDIITENADVTPSLGEKMLRVNYLSY